MTERQLQVVFVLTVIAWLLSIYVAAITAVSGAHFGSFAGDLGWAAFAVLFAPLITPFVALFGRLLGLGRTGRISVLGTSLPVQFALILLARMF